MAAKCDGPPTVMIALSDEAHLHSLRQSGGAAAGEPSRSTSIVARKPRGRPPGSKNKPKPAVVITRESDSTMQPLVFELADGSDVLESVAAFARRRRVGVSVLGGSGVVASVALRQPVISSAAFTISGRYDILSLSGTFLPPAAGGAAAARFTISVAGARGEVIGGAVAGPVKAAGTVVVMAAAFLAAEVLRLPEGVEEGGNVAAPAAAGKEVMRSEVAEDEVAVWASPGTCRSFYPAPAARPASHY